MTEELVFYTNPKSRGRTVRWMLEEIGAPYRSVVLDYGTTMKVPDYLAINPMGKVPAIVHRGRTVTESAAICAYLADAFPDAGLAPAPAARDQYYRWLFFFAGPFEAAIVNRAFGFEVPKERERAVGYGNYALVLDAIEQQLTRSAFLAGDAFTAADVYGGTHIGFGMQFSSLERRPAFEVYWERISQRPARLKAESLDGALA